MARAPSPLWLAAPSRFATFRRSRARLALGLLALLLIACLSALSDAGSPQTNHGREQHAGDMADVVLYESIVSGVRAGGDYYSVTAQALRAGDYPLRPFVTFRLPTLAMLQADLPDLVTTALLYGLVLAVILAWYLRLQPSFARAPPLVVALVLLLGGLVAFMQSGLMNFHEIWAGLLIALSLALRREDRWVEAVAFGMIAMLIRETAALYVGIMAVLAFAEGRRREAAGWGVTIVVFALVIACHAHAVGQVVRPMDQVSPGWGGMLGFGFFVKTMTLSTALQLVPLWLGALLVGLALFGWTAWDDALALRALTIFSAYAALLSLFGRADTFYWGLMIAPTILIGLVFVPDGLRDLSVAALDRRRFIVKRLTR
jgi:hypothetical protein